ncbi:MAG: conserved hypothetical protein 374, partial [uncultured Gemmatimonadaceae bacterium]
GAGAGHRDAVRAGGARDRRRPPRGPGLLRRLREVRRDRPRRVRRAQVAGRDVGDGLPPAVVHPHHGARRGVRVAAQAAVGGFEVGAV